MPDIGELTLRIRVDPETGKITGFRDEVDALAPKVRAVANEAEGANSAFTRPLENVGVHIFGHELLGTMGIAQGARPILQLLRVGIMEVGQSFGAAGAAAMPYVFGLTALAAVIYKVTEAHKVNQESLAETTRGYQDSIGSIDEYVAAGGRLSAAMQALAKDIKSATSETIAQIATNNKAKLSTDEETLTIAKNTEAYLKRSAARNNDNMGLEAAAKAVKAAQEAVDKDTAALEANRHGFATWEDYIKSGTNTLKTHTAATKEASDAAEKLAKQREAFEEKARANAIRNSEEMSKADENMAAAHENLLQITEELNDSTVQEDGNAYERRAAANRKFFDQKQTAILAAYAKEKEATIEAGGDVVRVEANKTAAISALNDNMAQRIRQNHTEMGEYILGVQGTITNGIANSVAASIVEGKSFADSMKALGKTVAQEIIADLVRIGIQHVIMDNAAVVGQTATTVAVGATTTALTAQTAASVAATAAAVTLGTTLPAGMVAASAATAAETGAVVGLTAALAAATAAAVALDAALVVAL